jgi:hypothetical protein
MQQIAIFRTMIAPLGIEDSGAVLSQLDDEGREHPVFYVSCDRLNIWSGNRMHGSSQQNQGILASIWLINQFYE